MKMYPLKFSPIFKERIWGGSKLREVFNKNIPDCLIGESWELTDIPGDRSKIANGPLAGKTIDEVLADYPLELTGIEGLTGNFPLMIKLIDAQDDLSVQVHPDEATCKRTGKGDPKTECWYIIDKARDAVIYKGLKPGTTREIFEEAIAAGTCAELLEKVPVSIGECHFLPSGTCHAIGAGLLIAEIQLPSDTTYRVFDWNRIDSKTGQGRELHVEDALESIHFDSTDDNLSVESVGRLVDYEKFNVDKGHQTAIDEVLHKRGLMEVFVIISGSGKVSNEQADVEDMEFAKGDTFLIPADYEGVISFKEECEYLRVTL